jgi:hypothetical protein
MAKIQFQDIHGVVNDPSNGAEYQTLGGVYNEQESAADTTAEELAWLAQFKHLPDDVVVVTPY